MLIDTILLLFPQCQGDTFFSLFTDGKRPKSAAPHLKELQESGQNAGGDKQNHLQCNQLTGQTEFGTGKQKLLFPITVSSHLFWGRNFRQCLLHSNNY